MAPAKSLVCFIASLIACSAALAQPATAPATRPGQFGAESAQLVYEKDEIVSVVANGMTVIAKRVPSPAVSVRGYVHAGSMNEGKWLGGGLSHLLEHLVAGGTNARRTEAQNRNLLQEIGNNSNAYTTVDHTAYFVTTTAEHLDQAVDLVTGWLLGAAITPAEFEREREVVQRELEMDKGNPDWVFYELANSNRYRQSPVGVPVIGYKAVIQNLTRDDVYAYYKMAYQPNNITFVVAGNLDPADMLKAVRKHVADAAPGRAFAHEVEAEPRILAPRAIVTTFPKLGQARLQLAFPTIKLSDPDLYALDLLATVLGRGESSLLVQEIRDRQDLVSSIDVYSDTPSHIAGTFAITMELDPGKIRQATDAVIALIEKVKADGIDPARLKRAQTQMVAARAFGKQTSEAVASTLAYDFMSTGDLHFTDRYTDALQKVTPEQVKAAANKYLDTAQLLTTAMLPEESGAAAGLPKAVDVLRAAVPSTKPKQAEVASEIQQFYLADGTSVLLKRMSASPIVVVQLWGLGGLTVEDKATNGLGNLAMRLVPRGTKTRSADQIAEFFDSIGGEFTSSCGNNSWNWQAQCLSKDFGKTLGVFADLVKNPTFPDKEVEQVRQRTLAAIASQDADWFAGAMRYFRSAYFGPRKSPYQFPVIGSAENVKGFTHAQIRDWYGQKIAPAKRVLAVFGDIDLKQAKAEIEKQFGPEKKPDAAHDPLTKVGSGSLRLGDPPKPSIDVAKVEINKTDNPQAAVIIGFDANLVIGDPDYFPLIMADTMTSGYGFPTGYISETLRGEGLVYDANAFLFSGRNKDLPGTFVAYAGCDPKNVSKVAESMLLNIARLQGTPEDIQPDWFARSKKLTITADALDNETAAAQAQTACLDELYGLGYSYHTGFAQRIKEVELSQVQEVARQRLSKCVVTISTPAPEAVSVNPGVRKYEKFPPVDLTPRGVQHDAGR